MRRLKGGELVAFPNILFIVFHAANMLVAGAVEAAPCHIGPSNTHSLPSHESSSQCLFCERDVFLSHGLSYAHHPLHQH